MTAKDNLQKKVTEDSEKMWKMKRDLTKLKEQIEREKEKISENEKVREVLITKIENLKIEENNTRVDMEKKKEVFERASKKLEKIRDVAVNKKSIQLNESNALYYEIEIVKEQTRNLYLKNAMLALCNESSKLKNILSNSLTEYGITIPSRTLSEKIDSISQSQSQSQLSITSRKSLVSNNDKLKK